MDIYRTFLAIILSFVILIGYQYFFVGFGPAEAPTEDTAVQTEQLTTETSSTQEATIASGSAVGAPAGVENVGRPARAAKTVIVDTDLYTASLSEDGGSITSFILKDYKETSAEGSPGMQMVKVDGAAEGFPLEFSWGSVAPAATFYDAGDGGIAFQGNTGSLVMNGRGNGLEIVREYTFSKDSYLMELT